MSRELFSGLWLTEHRRSGKMQDMDSIMLSHPPLCDRTCGVCGKCYSKRMSGYRSRLAAKQERNSRLLSNEFIPSKFNTINGVVRWISTGELNDWLQVRNIFSTALVNDHLTHVMWTKKAGLVRQYRRPGNMILVWSCTKLDYQKPFIPKGFSIGFYVYTSKDQIPKGMHLCHGKCKDCMFCYRVGASGLVAEILK